MNNAGGNAHLPQSDADDDLTPLARIARGWQDNFEANVLTAVLVTAALEKRLQDDGRVITVGSIAARTGAGSYGAAKAAVEAWSVTVAAELGAHGITANVVAPGLTVGTEFFRGRLSQERRDRLVAATRTGRAGTPEDVRPSWASWPHLPCGM